MNLVVPSPCETQSYNKSEYCTVRHSWTQINPVFSILIKFAAVSNSAVHKQSTTQLIGFAAQIINIIKNQEKQKHHIEKEKPR